MRDLAWTFVMALSMLFAGNSAVRGDFPCVLFFVAVAFLVLLLMDRPRRRCPVCGQ